MGDSRVLRARWAGTCTGCGSPIARGDQAWWDARTRALWCLSCYRQAPGAGVLTDGTGAAHGALPAYDVGAPGHSAQAEFDRRHTRREQRLDHTWGPFAGIVKFLSDDPQSTRAWAKGAAGERRVANELERKIGDRAVFLHDRCIPHRQSNIDLLVVASSGVWIVDAKQWHGKVERRNVGGLFTNDPRLYVGRRDRSKAIDGMGRQLLAVSQALGDPGIPVIPALCFVAAEWGWFAKPFQLKGVWATWPGRLAQTILEPGPLDRQQREAIAATLARRLPAK